MQLLQSRQMQRRPVVACVSSQCRGDWLRTVFPCHRPPAAAAAAATTARPDSHLLLGAQSSRKNSISHIDASLSRQPLVKGERLVRYEVNAVMVQVGPPASTSALGATSPLFHVTACSGMQCACGIRAACWALAATLRACLPRNSGWRHSVPAKKKVTFSRASLRKGQ